MPRTRRIAKPLGEVNLDNIENLPPRAERLRGHKSNWVATPFSPDAQQPSNTRHRYEAPQAGTRTGADDMGEPSEKTVSPVLQHLMLTPGRTLKTQRLLMHKHHEAKSRAEERCVGGGISLWPEMDNMRLTVSDLLGLLAGCTTLLVLTVAFFYYLHGETLDHLKHFMRQLHSFTSHHPLMITDQIVFQDSLQRWHEDFSSLLRYIDHSVEVSWESCPPTYPLVICLYISGICMLLYYLYENVFAKSRLTPKRIKQWVGLLVIIMTWTVLMFYFIILAHNLEKLVQRNVHSLNGQVEGLLFSELDLTKYESVVRYWTIRCLPPHTEGALTILGVVSVQNFTYYMIYYSVPIVTALFTPIVQLVMSLRAVYRPSPG